MIVLKLVLISAGLTKLKIKCSLVPWFLNYIIWIQVVLCPYWKLGPSGGIVLGENGKTWKLRILFMLEFIKHPLLGKNTFSLVSPFPGSQVNL